MSGSQKTPLLQRPEPLGIYLASQEPTLAPVRGAMAHAGADVDCRPGALTALVEDLWVGKILTFQNMTREASRDFVADVARLSRIEGMEGHARIADARINKSFPSQGSMRS